MLDKQYPFCRRKEMKLIVALPMALMDKNADFWELFRNKRGRYSVRRLDRN
jgi:hypothetical protein